MADITVVILTYNELLHLERALRHISSFAKEIFVIDSYSKDNTQEIARRYGAHIIEHPFINYAKQFQWALDNAPITTEWVMRLDADEIIEADLAAEIETKLSSLPAGVTGISLNRKTIFMGRWIKHGGRYPLMLLRIWRRGLAHIEDRWMDEHMVLAKGGSVRFEGGFSDNNLNSLSFFTDKHNKYASREAIDILDRRFGLYGSVELLSSRDGPRQAAVKRFAKARLYNALPFWVASSAYFFFRYILQLGFLDGVPGLIYHFLQGFWYRFLVGAKVREFESVLKNVDRAKAMTELSRMTGLSL